MSRFRELARSAMVENAGLKLVAILFSLALFIVAREETVRELEIDVPVAVSGYPKGQVLLSQPPSVLRVRVRGNLQKLTEVLARRSAYEVDLSQYDVSQTVYFQVDTIEGHLGEGVNVLSISPSNFELDLDRMDQVRVPVVLDIVKEPGPYARVDRGRVELTPRYINLSGPGTTLETIKQVRTEPLDLQRMTTDFNGKVALVAKWPGVKADTSSVQVTIPILETEGEKELPGCRIQVRNCPEGYVCEATPTFFRARLQGKEKVLDQVTAQNIINYVYVDATRLPIEKELVQRQFPAVEPTIELLKGATISLPKVRYFNITVTRR
jgi:YbbR domain-containing protein